MGDYNFYLRDFQVHTFFGARPRVIFTPAHNATFGQNIFATRRIICVPDEDGAATVSLVDSSLVSPPTPYRMRIEWLDPNADDGGYVGVDYPEFEIWADERTGIPLTDLIKVGLHNPLMWWTETYAPSFTAPNLWWFNPATNDIKKWD